MSVRPVLAKRKRNRYCPSNRGRKAQLDTNVPKGRPTGRTATPRTNTHDPAQEKKRGRKARGKVLSLLDRPVVHSNVVLAFAEFEIVPFTNNQAERDIRPVKTKLKVAG